MNVNYSLYLGLFIVCLAIRSGYEALKDLGKVNPRNKALFIVVFVAMTVLWISWFGMCPLDPWPLAVPGLVRWTGFALVVAGTLLAVGALTQLRGLENIEHLVTTGLFSRLRHPMYTGFFFWVIGWSTYHGALTSFLAGLFAIGNFLYWRGLEDRRLASHFGDIFRVYRKQTWF